MTTAIDCELVDNIKKILGSWISKVNRVEIFKQKLTLTDDDAYDDTDELELVGNEVCALGLGEKAMLRC
ncbi:MAG: hypothetical protein ACREHG_02755 [Candidatus Saccharimonadales bacterium]